MPTQGVKLHQIEEVSMFDHISIGVRDLARTKRFYDAVLRPLGYTCLSEDAGALGIRTGQGRPLDRQGWAAGAARS
jgi:catechol 2,3-dioxygenase-like lactoylglutathione lyase family enzyme